MSEPAPRLFVRGKYQLARCDPGSSATGRRLTEHEVLEAYGTEFLPEIDERLSAVLLASPRAIEQAFRTRREGLGLTREQIASSAEVDPDVVKDAETNAGRVDLRRLEHLAFVLGLDPAQLSVDETAGADVELGVRLRVLERDAPGRGAVRLDPRTVLRF